MQKFIKKSIALLLTLALLCSVLMLGGCGKMTFWESVRQGMSIEKGDVTAKIKIDTNDETSLFSSMGLTLDGTVNSYSSFEFDLSADSDGENTQLTSIICNGEKIYLDLKQLMTSVYASYGADGDAIDSAFNGKKYMSVDMSEIMDSMELDSDESKLLDTAGIQGVSIFIMQLCDILQSAAESTDSEILGNDGDKFTFTLNETNAVPFCNKLGELLDENKASLINSFLAELEKSGAEDTVEEFRNNQEEYSEELDGMIDSLKDLKSDDIGESKFTITAYSQLTKEDSLNWDFGVTASVTEEDVDTDMEISFFITENKEDKEITKVDDSEAIDYKELTGSATTAFEDSDEAYEDFDADDVFIGDSEEDTTPLEVDTSKATGKMFRDDIFFTVNGKKVEMKCDAKDLTATGLNFPDYFDIKEEIEPGEYTSTYAYINSEDENIYLGFCNDDDGYEKISECELTDLEIEDTYASGLKGFALMGDITFDSTMDDIIAKYGKDIDLESSCVFDDYSYYIWTQGLDSVEIVFNDAEKRIESMIVSINDY